MAVPRQIPAVWWSSECLPCERAIWFDRWCGRTCVDRYIGCVRWQWCDCLTAATRGTHVRHTRRPPVNQPHTNSKSPTIHRTLALSDAWTAAHLAPSCLPIFHRHCPVLTINWLKLFACTNGHWLHNFIVTCQKVSQWRPTNCTSLCGFP